MFITNLVFLFILEEKFYILDHLAVTVCSATSRGQNILHSSKFIAAIGQSINTIETQCSKIHDMIIVLINKIGLTLLIKLQRQNWASHLNSDIENFATALVTFGHICKATKYHRINHLSQGTLGAQ